MPSANNEATGVERTGTFILGAERLFGYAATTSTVESKGIDPAVKTTTTHSNLGLLVTNATSALTVPRIAFDINVFSGVTLGGAFGYASSSGEAESKVGQSTVKDDGPKARAVVFAPRLGWLTMSGMTGFWGRAGFTYFSSSEESSTSGTTPTKTEVTGSGLSAQLEPSLLIAPIDHVVFSVGLHLNIPLSGSVTVKQIGTTAADTTEFDAKLTSYGVTAGLHTWF